LQNRWLDQLNTVWEQAAAQMNAPAEIVRRMAHPLTLLLNTISQNLEPAPAVRSAGAVKEMVYPVKRRGLEASGLPVFNPLFCTALDLQQPPFVLGNLLPDCQYRLTVRGVQNSEWLYETTLTTTEEGTLETGFVQILKEYRHSISGNPSVVWILRQLASTNAAGWTSGMIWLRDETLEFNGQHEDMLSRFTLEDAINDEFKTIIEINLLLAQGYYTQAYEQARQALIFAKNTGQEPGSLYVVSLWQFCRQILHEMKNKLSTAEPVFRLIQPDWNAVTSLQKLYEQIEERE